MSEPYTTGRYAELNPDWHASDAPHKARSLADMIRFAGLQPRTVVDVGCGTGDVLRELCGELEDHLPDTVWEGWDIAREAIRRARKHEGGRLLYVGEDFLASERQADLLLCIDVVEHVPDDLAFLRAMRGRADWFLFRLPLDLNALDLVRPGRLLEARRRYGHLHMYNREVALDLLQSAGYRVEAAVYDRIPPVLDTPRRRLADGVRRALYNRWPDMTVRVLGGWSLMVLARSGSYQPS